ncbi:hypothetical protein ABIF63_006135 [Bradyrhizobium japonicum]|uniref:Chitin-binding type-3 domain-containing protein n=1 Tax=Bradyrhizobium japonicum TaxID=375 RepID=A0ABV2RYQ8_BRAJP
MTALSSYSTGTVAVAADGTTVTGTSTLWLNTGNVKPGDLFQSGHFVAKITDVTDDTHLVIVPWPGSTLSGATYAIWKESQQRIVGETYARDVDKAVGAWNTSGFFVFVDIAQTAPDPSLGDDGQYAFQPTTGKTWVKSAGVWSYLGIYKAFQLKGAWSGATAYTVGDVVSLNGSSYACLLDHTNHTPPNATYWQLLAAKGDTGATGAGYGGTSTTSLAIGTGSKVFTTQAGLAYTNGARVRASSAANTSNWMEGLATYSGTTLTINVDKIGGSGTQADWNFNVIGEPGTGAVTSIAGNTGAFTLGAGLTNTTNVLVVDPSYLRGFISGLTLSNDAVTPNTILDIAAGVATSDDQAGIIKLSSAITKSTGGAWAAGSGSNGMGNGLTIAANTWYFPFLAANAGSPDVWFDTSPVGANRPSGITDTKKRRIGAFKTNGSAQIIAFLHFGNDFLWSVPTNDYIGNNPGTSAVLAALNTPAGIVTRAKVWVWMQSAETSPVRRTLLLTSPNQPATAPTAGVLSSMAAGTPAGSGPAAQGTVQSEYNIWTDTSRQIRFQLDGSGSGTSVFLNTVGWTDLL